jgi:tyrosine-specific transport protein
MKRYNKLFGGVLLITGTSIGAGMLALPVATFFAGFIPSLVMFVIAWGLMLISANFFLDVNLEIKGEPNFISMAENTLGPIGKVVSWVFYLLLLYSLLAAYLAACSPFFSLSFEAIFHKELPSWIAPFSLPIVFGGFIYLGTQGLDYFNRILMLGLAISYFLLVGGIPEHVETSRLLHVDFPAGMLAVPIIIASFGYHIIIPTLTTYLDHRRKLLRIALVIGSIIPFLIYTIWQWMVIGAVPFQGLLGAFTKGLPSTEPLSTALHSNWIGSCSLFFSFFAISTSFLGVSLSLSDFLLDGLKIKKNKRGKLLAIALTFIPPIIFVFSYQKGFYLALEYAGIFVVVLLGILPSLMALRLKTNAWYRSFKGRAFVFVTLLLFFAVIVLSIAEKLGYLQQFIESYV